MPRLTPRLAATLAAGLLAAALPAGCSDGPAPQWVVPPAPTVDYAQWQAGISSPVADPLFPRHGNTDLDVLHYGLKLSWDPTAKVLTGTATLRIRPTKDAPEVRLDFGSYVLESVTVDGIETTASLPPNHVLTVSTAVRKDKPITLVVSYHGMPYHTQWVRLDSPPISLGLVVTKKNWLWTMQEPYGAYTWYPANDHPSDKALYDIEIAVPKGWTAIAGGTPVPAPAGTFRYRSTEPVSPSMQTLAVGKYRKLTVKGPRGIPLTFWYRPGDARLLPSLRKAPSMLSFLEKAFGRYPFRTGGAVLVDSGAVVATKQMITLGGRIDRDEPLVLETLLVHEFANQWFGVSVSPATWKELWLNEGWASYAQHLYLQNRLGVNNTFTKGFLRKYDAEYRKKFSPPGQPEADDFAESNILVCSAAMLNALHGALGDQKFFALATAWAQQHRNSVQTRASFTAFVNRQTGRDFTRLIDAWLDGAKTPGP
jgi:aminopeptidase N